MDLKFDLNFKVQLLLNLNILKQIHNQINLTFSFILKVQNPAKQTKQNKTKVTPKTKGMMYWRNNNCDRGDVETLYQT